MAEIPETEAMLVQSRDAFYRMSMLDTMAKNEALLAFAVLIDENREFLLQENQKDLKRAQEDKISESLYQRLKLDAGKISQLVQGLRDLATLPDPIGRTLSRMLLDEGLVLEKITVPLGVIGIIFESRPDVIPQVLSLILKSGNAVILKGGKEAGHSNAAFMSLVKQLNKTCKLPDAWATLVESREAVHDILHYPQYVDLIIPRGSNQLVQSIMEATRIPVLGHADGVCHLYVHESADIEKSVPLTIDAKAQYPSACNALETLLVDAPIAEAFLPVFCEAAERANITMRGCERSRKICPSITPATEDDWRTEYGDLTLSIKVVDGLKEAIGHINRYGSHHTDAILSSDPKAIEAFMTSVDSACVFANASTRFADGFRFGLGAEIGISTSKTHARGPVGLEGLVSTKYRLAGDYHKVADYAGENARPFQHKPLQK